MAQAATATPTGPKPGQMIQEKEAIKPIPEDRMIGASFARGETMLVTLIGNEVIQEGPQPIEKWANIARRLSVGQHIEVGNDAGSFWAWCRVERLHGTPGGGLRGLTLRFIAPPIVSNLAEEPVTATGDFYVRHLGMARRWAVIDPKGHILIEGLNSEAEARNHMIRAQTNPKPL
jgi:hypothetical protein